MLLPPLKRYLNKYILVFICSVSGMEASENVNAWYDLWNQCEESNREKLFVDLLYYAHQPIARNWQEALSRCKILQNIIATSQWKSADTRIKKIIEEAINTEVTSLQGAIDTNVPNWFGKEETKYLTNNSFSSLCSHQVFRANLWSADYPHFRPEDVQMGDSILVQPAHLELFFDVYHPLIEFPYILVTSNHDISMPGKFQQMLNDEKIIAWFGCNMDDTKDTKLHPMPLGVSSSLKHPEYLGHLIDQLVFKHQNKQKKHLLYVNFYLGSHPSREKAFQAFKNKKWCTVIHDKKPQEEYLKDLAQSKFVLSPRGGGLDCWRTWEALALGSFPVFLHSSLDPLFEGLPVVIVESWDQVTEEFLHNKYAELSKHPYCLDKLLTSYWKDQIALCKELYLRSHRK